MTLMEQKMFKTCLQYITATDEWSRQLVIAEARKLLNHAHIDDCRPTIETLVDRLLTEVGVPAHLVGYDFLASAITRFAKAECVSFPRLTDVCTAVAVEFDSTIARVERGIRHAIEWVFTNVEWEELAVLFGGSVGGVNGYPTTHQFVATMAREVKRRAKEV